MLMITGLALAAPCEFSGQTEETLGMEHMEWAWDQDSSTWTNGSNFLLGLALEEDQAVEEVGVLVEGEASFDLTIWALPVGGTDFQELVAKSGTLSEGAHRGEWTTPSVLATELIYSLKTTEPVGFQVVCEASPLQEFTVRGGGGFTSCSFGLQDSLSLTVFPLMFSALRRRRNL